MGVLVSALMASIVIKSTNDKDINQYEQCQAIHWTCETSRLTAVRGPEIEYIYTCRFGYRDSVSLADLSA